MDGLDRNIVQYTAVGLMAFRGHLMCIYTSSVSFYSLVANDEFHVILFVFLKFSTHRRKTSSFE
jgi:hypothetical protein